MAEPVPVLPEPTDDERMQVAIELAQGRTSPAAASLLEGQRLASRRKMVTALVAAVVIGGLVGWVIAVNDDNLTRRPSIPAWWSAVGWTLWIVGFIWCTVLVVRLVRSGWYRRQRERVRPFTVLTSRQRKAVVKQLRGTVPMVTAQMPLVRLMAENVISGATNLRLFGAITVLLGGNAIRSGTVVQWSVFVVLTAMVVIGTVSNRQLLRRSRAVLARGRSPAADEVVS